MKAFCKYFLVIAAVSVFVSGTGFRKKQPPADQLRGAWMHEGINGEHVLQFVDGYNTHTVYNKSGKKFGETRGGPYTTNGNKLNITYEFDTRNKEHIGQLLSQNFSIKDDELTINSNGQKLVFKRLDDGTAPLTGLWHITGRMQEGKVVPILRTGTRKTVKVLSGTRFQWAAIDPGTQQFFGTGGGAYEFRNGKYTEHIEFFSRDSSRVGASLSFDGKLDNGEWHHSGLSSRGEKIYEIWSRIKN